MNNLKLISFLLVLLSTVLSAQDEHFSQFYAIPMHMNPALTGAYAGTYRMNLVYRSQWGSTFDTPYKTIAAGGDTRISLKRNNNKSVDQIGIGLIFINDEVAEFQVSTNKLSAYSAYHIQLGGKNKAYLGAGLKIGVIQRNLNYGNLTFQDQFNQVDGFDQPTNEFLPPNNFGRMDLSTGINYSMELPGSRIYLGLGYHHFTRPSFSFYNQLEPVPAGIDVSQSLDPKLTAHFSLDKKLNYSLELQPRVIYQQQGIHNQVDIGSNIEYTFDSRATSFVLGLWLTGINDLDGFHLENVTPLLSLIHI